LPVLLGPHRRCKEKATAADTQIQQANQKVADLEAQIASKKALVDELTARKAELEQGMPSGTGTGETGTE